MAENLTVKSHEIIGINKVCPYETELVLERAKRIENTPGVDSTSYHRQPVKKTYSKVHSLTDITHEIHFAGGTIHQAKDCISDPNIKLGIIIWFGAASAIGRPSHSKALYHDDELYYFLSWTDILGKGHGREQNPSRVRNKIMINYLQRVENERHKELILEQIRNIDLV